MLSRDRRVGLLIAGASALAIGAVVWAWLGPRGKELVTAEPSHPGEEDLGPMHRTDGEDLELMRRLVEAVERYETAAASDRAALEMDRKREKRAIVAVIWTLVSLALVDAVQHDPVGHFVTANWSSLPVALPVIGLVAAFIYRAFRIRLFTQYFVYAIAVLTMAISADYLLGLSNYSEREIGIVFGLVSLFYLVRMAYDEDGNLSPGAAEIATLIKSRERLVRIVFGLLLVLVTVAAAWYVGSAAPRADLLGFVRNALVLAFLLALIVVLQLLDRRRMRRSQGANRRPPVPRDRPDGA